MYVSNSFQSLKISQREIPTHAGQSRVREQIRMTLKTSLFSLGINLV
jgi:hypothetical protein